MALWWVVNSHSYTSYSRADNRNKTSYILFAIFIIPQALARNFATLVVCRAIAGAFGGTLQNSADGLASNIFLTHRERVFPLTLYVFALVFGVTMGPVLGAAFQPLGWRWSVFPTSSLLYSTTQHSYRVFWIEFIIYGACAPVVVIFMKESRGPILRARLFPEADSTKPTKHEAMRTFKETIVRSALLLTTEPTVTAFTLWSAFAFGLVFISTQSIPIVFSGTYNWPSYTDGLVQSSIGIGQVVGLLLTTFYQNRLYTHSAGHNPDHPGTPIPEAILHLSIPSTAVALAGGLFMYGWSTEQTHWIVPAVALALVGYAIMVIVTAASIYVTDSYAGYAASAIGAVAFGENVFAAFLPLAAKPMYLRLGYQWASSLLGFVAAVLALAPVVLIWKGRAIRERSVAIRRMNIEGL